jgi:hypothetical protein
MMYLKEIAMPYKVNIDGSIECMDAREALNLQELILQRAAQHRPVTNGTSQAGAHEPEESNELPDLGRMFLAALLEQPRTAQEVAQRLDTSTHSFPPMYRGIKKWADAAGLDYDTLIIRSPGPSGDVLSINERALNIVTHAVRT